MRRGEEKTWLWRGDWKCANFVHNKHTKASPPLRSLKFRPKYQAGVLYLEGGFTSRASARRTLVHPPLWFQIQATLTEWAPHLRPCSGLFLHAPGPHNARVLYFEGGPLAKGDPRIQSIPFTTGARRSPPSRNEWQWVAASATGRLDWGVSGMMASQAPPHRQSC